jgi:glycosyltransferase involved in cell wall biosynthesis
MAARSDIYSGLANTGPRPSILYVSYPLLAISDQSAGGAEQMLLTLEREMTRRGHRTTVAACQGSRVSGRLLVTGEAARAADVFQEREREHCARILDYLLNHPAEFDLVHDESGSFFRHAERCPMPVLATLHLPRGFYRDDCLHRCSSPNLVFNCVSQSQARTFADLPNLIGVVQNGIAIERFAVCERKRDYLLWMGRICEEKAPHLAIAAAKQAGASLILAGQVYPFSYHQQYFEREILPWLGADVEFVDSPSFAQKVYLLQNARALLLTSTAEETSSLVAMEAMACGTPVIAMRRGAFPEIVAHGETGFIVDDVRDMALAAAEVSKIRSAACRRRVEQMFSSRRMARDYEALYRRIVGARRARAVA